MRDGARSDCVWVVVAGGGAGPTAEDLTLPKKNVFIPTDFSLRCEAPQPVASDPAAPGTGGFFGNGAEQGALGAQEYSVDKNGDDAPELQRVRTQHLCLVCALRPLASSHSACQECWFKRQCVQFPDASRDTYSCATFCPSQVRVSPAKFSPIFLSLCFSCVLPILSCRSACKAHIAEPASTATTVATHIAFFAPYIGTLYRTCLVLTCACWVCRCPRFPHRQTC